MYSAAAVVLAITDLEWATRESQAIRGLGVFGQKIRSELDRADGIVRRHGDDSGDLWQLRGDGAF
jgi:hypothetical protein